MGADGGRVVLYEPQVATWTDQRVLTLHAAVSYTATGETAAMLGTIVAEADTRVSVDERLVGFSSFRVMRASFHLGFER